MINFGTNLPNLHRSPDGACVNSSRLAAASQQLAQTAPATFSQTLAQFTSDPNSSQVTPTAVESQNPAGGQNSGAPPSGLSGLVPPTETTSWDPSSSAGGGSAATATHWYADSAADDAYWARQPPAVQQLREIESEPQREQLAAQLASQGYSIDVPVMVWGWDAGLTTQLREADGYTWVPSALQQPISEAPGINVPGLTPYDPSHPPAGSILVG
jgi:hypothetical protein